ncbi:efflux RND transporter periplasmic adaptor subunit [Solimonas fluminis]|nr:efflux RND transporter periplasmic adaptor subunit [Solimonas fluminis]
MNKKILIALTLVLAAAAGFGWWYAREGEGHRHELVKKVDAQGQAYWTCPMHPQVRQDHPGNCPICGMKLVKREDQPTATLAKSSATERQVLYWYDPMKPEVHFDKPGKSPFMDMDLLPKYAEETAMPDGAGVTIEIDPRMAQNLGMRTAPVERGTFWQRIDAVGSVAVDERRIVSVEARAAGWVEHLEVRAVGDTVRRGQVVAGVYAPDLLAAQEELALARKLGDPTLIDAARTRLKLLGVGGGSGGPQRQVGIVAPQGGVVIELMVREGGQVTPGMPLMRLADLSSIWILVEVPETQAGWVAVGKPAEARLKSQPERVFEGTVDYVYPMLDTQTRTLKVRLVFDNPDLALKPGMFADVTLFGGAKRDVVMVPSEAVIRTGDRSVVLVAEAAGRYRPVHVELGPERQDQTVILSGLSEGQQVVVSGQFLLDSEASLRGAYQRMGGPASTDKAAMAPEPAP